MEGCTVEEDFRRYGGTVISSEKRDFKFKPAREQLEAIERWKKGYREMRTRRREAEEAVLAPLN